MNLRKKLTIASILMILIPFIVSVLLCVIVVFYKGDSTLNRLKSLYENDNGLLSVQTILYSHESRILSYTPSKYYENDDDDDDGTRINQESAAYAFGNLIKELGIMEIGRAHV